MLKFAGQFGYHVFRSFDLFSWGSGLTFGFIMCYELVWDFNLEISMSSHEIAQSP